MPKHIVPMHQHVQPLAAPPQLAYNNGPLLTAVQVTTIFWGAAWSQVPQSGLIPRLNSFFDFVLASSLLDLMAQYSVAGQSIGHGRRIGTVTVIDSEPGGGSGQVSDAQIETALQGWINDGRVAAANANTLYFIYLPPNVTVTDPQGGASCTQLCGYHWYIPGTNPQIYYAVMPFPSCSGCLGSLAQFDALTSTSSHELCEAITDPQPWSGWNDNNNGEIGDICAWQTGALGAYTVQLEWSNAQNACEISPPVSPGDLWVNWWDGAAWHWDKQGTPQGVTIGSAVGVLTMMDNRNAEQRPYAFVKGSDGNLWVNWWDGAAWHWDNQGTPLGTKIGSAVGVLTKMDNPNAQQRPYVFVLGTDGNLWVNWWDGAAWHWDNQRTPQGITILRPVGVLTKMDNPNAEQRPYAFVTGSDGNLWVNWWDGAAWHWDNQGRPLGVDLTPPALRDLAVGVLTKMDNPSAEERPYVFVQGSDGNMWVNWWDGATWHWDNQGAPPGASIAGTVGVLTMMNNPNAEQRPYVFVIGFTEPAAQAIEWSLWVNWWDGAAWHWDKQGTPQGVAIVGAVGILTMMDNRNAEQRPYAFVKGSDGNLWVNWWDGAAWHWDNQVAPLGRKIGSAVGVLTKMDNPSAQQRPYAFVVEQ